ncbi:MAG: DUF2177 family protein [Thermodesulfobacteriota bacterium]|nr:DUF2177 family protein [Thermodesulfobacteriota bacterium]
MTMSFYVKLYLLTIPVFFAIDILWLGIVAKDFYQKHLGSRFGPQVNWTAATFFYLIFIIGILLFAVVPALEKGSWTRALIWGGLYGFFTYATYDLTNLATLRDWPLKVVVVDMIWGICLCSSVSVVSFYMGRWLG